MPDKDDKTEHKKKRGRPRKVRTVDEIEALREKQRLYSAEYYRKKKEKKAQKAHALKRRGPVKKEEEKKLKLELKLEFDKQNN